MSKPEQTMAASDRRDDGGNNGATVSRILRSLALVCSLQQFGFRFYPAGRAPRRHVRAVRARFQQPFDWQLLRDA